MSDILSHSLGFGDYLKSFRLKEKMTQREFSKKIGVSIQTILKWEHSQTVPSKNSLINKLSARLHIPVQEFSKLKGMRKLQRRQNKISQSKDPVISASWLNYVPLLDDKVHALPMTEITNPAKWTGKRFFLPGDLFSGFIFAFEIKNKDMEPSYHSGDTVLVDLREPVKTGFPAVIKIKNHPPVCRIYSIQNNLRVLSPVNSKASLLSVEEADIEWCYAVVRHMSHRFN